MKLKCDECKGVGTYDCDSEPGPYGRQITVECEDCNGEGWIEVEDEDDDDVFIKDMNEKIKEQWHDQIISVTFHPMNVSRNYHITYFISRGDVTAEETPLLGGLTLSADSITHAVTIFINSTKVNEREIKYIVEL